MGCESPAATRVSEQLKPVGCEWDACTPPYAWATLRLEVAEYLLAARETRVADLESCIAAGRCPRGDFHPEPLHYEDTLGLPPAEARAFCRAYGRQLASRFLTAGGPAVATRVTIFDRRWSRRGNSRRDF
jgi:hypothetical protein